MGLVSFVNRRLSFNAMRSQSDFTGSGQGLCAVQGGYLTAGDDAFLGEVLAEVPEEVSLPPGVGFRVVVSGRARELRAGVCDEVYRICREAIVNAFRHSQARHIEAEIEYRSSELRIAVRDNGCGIDPQELQQGWNTYWGLRGMRERASRIGGQLSLFSKVARGTEIELRVPDRFAFKQCPSLR